MVTTGHLTPSTAVQLPLKKPWPLLYVTFWSVHLSQMFLYQTVNMFISAVNLDLGTLRLNETDQFWNHSLVVIIGSACFHTSVLASFTADNY